MLRPYRGFALAIGTVDIAVFICKSPIYREHENDCTWHQTRDGRIGGVERAGRWAAAWVRDGTAHRRSDARLAAIHSRVALSAAVQTGKTRMGAWRLGNQRHGTA